ncbi:MAG: Cache 3/Cache 2 fusion domain-containing protein, partial [Wenzhouxiangellaceae bacterium]|nr:Cache 3/Cache 2 fusion domain-containing protein [Wenzhouxiangellaceae bacterium]
MNVSRKLTDYSLGVKILAVMMILIIVPTITLGLIAYSKSRSAIEDQVDGLLQVQIDDVVRMVDTTYTLASNALEAQLATFRHVFNSRGQPTIIDGQMVLVDQIEEDDPIRYAVAADFTLVDQISEMTGAAATIFQKVGGQAVRISTNVVDGDGNRAIGTVVSQPVFDAVITRGETFFGVADVVGVSYITAYEPIRNASGEIIGILFVGVTEESLYGPLWRELAQIRIGESGYVYIMNEDGRLIVHPTAKGEVLTNTLPAAREMLEQRMNVRESARQVEYSWDGRPTSAWYRYVDELGWIVASNAKPEEFMGPAIAIRNVIFLLLFVFIGIGALLSLLLGQWVARSMKRLVKLGRQVQAGDLEQARVEAGQIAVDGIRRDEIGLVAHVFQGVIETFVSVSEELDSVNKSIKNGNLGARGNSQKYSGQYGLIVAEFNEAMESVIGPLNMAADYVDRISRGDIPEKITDSYNGDFNKIKDNLNTCIDSLNGLIEEMNEMSRQHDLGDIDIKVDEARFEGAYREMARGVNEMVFGHIAVKKKAIACVSEFGKGNMDAELEKFPGKKKFINDGIEQVRSNIKDLIAEMNNMSRQHDLGDIDVKVNEARFEGAFCDMAQGVNEMVFGHIAVKKK